jgi:hypothetical protein
LANPGGMAILRANRGGMASMEAIQRANLGGMASMEAIQRANLGGKMTAALTQARGAPFTEAIT